MLSLAELHIFLSFMDLFSSTECKCICVFVCVCILRARGRRTQVLFMGKSLDI